MRREGWKLTCSVSSSRNFKSTASPVSLFVTGITLFKASARREGGISIAVVTIFAAIYFTIKFKSHLVPSFASQAWGREC